MILDQFRLDGKNALVTGSRTGMGAAIARAFAQAGANMMLNARTESTLIPVRDELRALGTRVEICAADVAEPSSATKLVDATVEAFGSIDILVNNAGFTRRVPSEEYSWEDWDALIQVHLSAVFRLCQLAGRKMLAQGSGKIVNMASLMSFQGGLKIPAYSAAKGGVAQLTKALANEWASRGVNVNAIAPGYVATELTEALQNDPVRAPEILLRIPAGRWGKPEDIAGAAVFLASPASDYVNGHILAVDGGWLGR